MRILHVIVSLDPANGGSVAACLRLCHELAQRGEDVALYTTFDARRPAEASQRLADAGRVDIRSFPAQVSLYGFSLPLFNALRKAIARTDIVHVHGLYRFDFVAATSLCRYYGVPYIIKPHGSLDPFSFRVRRWRKWLPEQLVVAPAMARASAVQFSNEEEMQLAASTGLFRAGNGKPVFNGVTVPEGVDAEDLDSQGSPEDFRRAHPETRGKKIVLFLSRLAPKKGLDILAKAFALVCRQRSDVRLVIAGPDNEGCCAKVRGWLEEEGVLDRVTFTGMVIGAARSSTYRAADVFVLPSYGENFGMVVTEAMAYGVPVVISNRVNIWRDIEQAEAGLVVDCDPGQTGQAIIRLLEHPSLAQRLGRQGQFLVRQHFTWQKAGDQMQSIYRQIVAEAALANRTS